ncbi:hypothetical protein HRED_10881, partial [Candidatus Haloredivivus sp. G17]
MNEREAIIQLLEEMPEQSAAEIPRPILLMEAQQMEL